jgi:hypothetical protein
VRIWQKSNKQNTAGFWRMDCVYECYLMYHAALLSYHLNLTCWKWKFNSGNCKSVIFIWKLAYKLKYNTLSSDSA